jgi:hypothetical protein
MGVHYDWNIEVIAQFYATLFIEEVEYVRAMHWMTEGKWYHMLPSEDCIPVRPVWVTGGSLQHCRERNPPPHSKSCLGFYLACVTLTMPLRQGFMRRENPARSFKRI